MGEDGRGPVGLPTGGAVAAAGGSSLAARARALIEANHGTHRGLVRGLLGQLEYVFGTADNYLDCDFRTVNRLVFVCLGNINRSAFAHICALSLGVRAASVGLATSAGASAPARTVDAAAQLGRDLAGHRATPLADFSRETGDLFMVMELRHARRLRKLGIPGEQIALLGAWAMPIRLHIHDPHGLSDRYLMTCLRILDTAVLNLVNRLRHEGSPCVGAAT